MSLDGAIHDFVNWLENRTNEYERRLGGIISERDRLIIKTEAAELHVVQAKFAELFRAHVPHGDENSFPRSLKKSAEITTS